MNIASDRKGQYVKKIISQSSCVNWNTLLSISHLGHGNRKYSTFPYVIRNPKPSDHCLIQCRPPKVNSQSKKQPSALLENIHKSLLALRTALSTPKAQVITSLILLCPPQQVFLEQQVGNQEVHIPKPLPQAKMRNSVLTFNRQRLMQQKSIQSHRRKINNCFIPYKLNLVKTGCRNLGQSTALQMSQNSMDQNLLPPLFLYDRSGKNFV